MRVVVIEFFFFYLLFALSSSFKDVVENESQMLNVSPESSFHRLKKVEKRNEEIWARNSFFFAIAFFRSIGEGGASSEEPGPRRGRRKEDGRRLAILSLEEKKEIWIRSIGRTNSKKMIRIC